MKFGGIFFKIFQSLVGEVWGEIALYPFFCYLSEFGSSDVFFFPIWRKLKQFYKIYK